MKVEDEGAILFLRRCPAFPDQAVSLGVGPKGRNYITQNFYRRIPDWWWSQSNPQEKLSRQAAPSDTATEPLPSTNCHVHNSAFRNHPASLERSVDSKLLMKTWLHRCQSSHKDCSANPKAFLPTRLIDVEAFKGSLDVQLVDSAPLKLACVRKRITYPGYLALSHCWGPEDKRPIVTNRDSLEARQTRILAKDLSKTFLDAVTVTRNLGQRYLWIDSLCIIQGDKDDWAREAARMADVYGNSLCTISALSSEDGTQGCRINEDLRRSTGNSFVDIPFNRTTHGSIRMYRHPPTPWGVEYGDDITGVRKTTVRNPLRSRGWTLQEAELSRRNIFFADRQLLWRCRELKGTAELPWAEQESRGNLEANSWPLCDGLRDDLTEGAFAEVRLRWYQLVEEYSLRNLTYDSDKLTALAGLARDYQRNVPGADYAAGMWGPHPPLLHPSRVIGFPFMKDRERLKLHAGTEAIAAHCTATLLWRSTNKKARRYMKYVAPTWSWASVKGRISYDSQLIEPHGNSYDRMGIKEQLSGCDFSGLQWGSLTAKPAQGDKYGAVKPRAFLSLRGALLAQCSVPSKPFSEFPPTVQKRARQDSPIDQIMARIQLVLPETNGDDMTGEPLMVNGRTVGVFLRDCADDSPCIDKDTFCLRIRGEDLFSLVRHDFGSEQEAAGTDMIMGIVIVRTVTPESAETYRRIGLARWVKAAIFKRCRPVNIKLV
jgi:hypothetical protein